MGKYGESAIHAVELVVSGKIDYPDEAWDISTSEKFGKGTSAQNKGCPKGAFLGLCEEGLIKGVPAGSYTKSKKNKAYALKAVQILKENPAVRFDKRELWSKVMAGEDKKHNEQMDVVTSLWINGLIVI